MAKARPSKPISPAMHGLLDYGLAAGNLLVPRAFGMSRRARRLFAAFGLVQGGLNALTVQPFAVSRVVPFPLHGTIDKSSAPLYFALPPLLGLMRERKACLYWLLTGAALVVVYNLTDWEAKPVSR
jgi:hypothetical protein